MMYFKLKNHLKYILTGSNTPKIIRTTNIVYLALPNLSLKLFRAVFARRGCKTANVKNMTSKPGASRNKIFEGSPILSQLI